MSTTRPSVGYHILALATIFVWGTTFVSTKVLLSHGLTPPEIMFYRFIIAYALVWIFTRKVWADTWRDELLLAVAGFTGGTLYFLAENTAIDYSITSNVALVVCVTPVLTALLTSICYKERITARLVVGSVVALSGVGFVVLNGTVLHIHPLGDALALVAAMAWAVYSVVIRRFDGYYSTWFCHAQGLFLWYCLDGTLYRCGHGRWATSRQTLYPCGAGQCALSLGGGFYALFLFVEPRVGKDRHYTCVQLYVYAAFGVVGLLCGGAGRTHYTYCAWGNRAYIVGYLSG